MSLCEASDFRIVILLGATQDLLAQQVVDDGRGESKCFSPCAFRGSARMEDVMKRLYVSIGLFVAIFAAWPAQTQEAVFLIRHAERDWSADDALVEKGRERARAWGRVLADAGLDVVITSKKQRTRQTGQPIADMLNVPIMAISRYDYEELLEILKTEFDDERVLIVSHSSSIPVILRSMGYPETVRIPKSDYNDLFVVHPGANGDPNVVRFNVE